MSAFSPSIAISLAGAKKLAHNSSSGMPLSRVFTVVAPDRPWRRALSSGAFTTLRGGTLRIQRRAFNVWLEQRNVDGNCTPALRAGSRGREFADPPGGKFVPIRLGRECRDALQNLELMGNSSHGFQPPSVSMDITR
jgi:hypothetical protein